MSGGPLVCLAERWAGERIDNLLWVLVEPATGTKWNITANGGRLCVSVAPNANETCRLSSLQRWNVAPTKLSGAGSIIKSFEVEFEIYIDDGTNLTPPGECMFGLCDATNTKVSTVNDFIGWTTDGIDWESTVIDGGQVDNISTTHPVNGWARLKFLIINDDVHFWVNGVYMRKVDVSSITGPLYFTFFTETGAGAAQTIYMTHINGRPDDSPIVENYQNDPPVYFTKKAVDKTFLLRLVNRFNPREAVTGRVFGDITVKYAADSASSLSTYSVLTADWVEVGEGWYTLSIGASEFSDNNTIYEITVKDSLNYFSDYTFLVHVTDMTMDEWQDFAGTGSSGTYNITKNMEDNRQYHGEDVALMNDLRNLIVKTKNTTKNILDKQKKEGK